MKKLSLIALLAGLTMTAGAAVSVVPTTHVNQPIVAMAATLDEDKADTIGLFVDFNTYAIGVLDNRLSNGMEANVNMKLVAIESVINAATDADDLWVKTKAQTSEYLLYIFDQAGITDFFRQMEFANALAGLDGAANRLVALEALLEDTLLDTVEAANAGYQAQLVTKKTDTLKSLFATVGCNIADAQARLDAAIGLDGLVTVMKELSAEGAEWTEAMIARITNATTLQEVDAMCNLAIAEIQDARNEAADKLAAAKAQAIATLETTYAGYVTDDMKNAINTAADLDAVEVAKLKAEKDIKATIAAEEAAAKLVAAKAQAIATLETTYAGYVTDAMKNAINAAADVDAVAIAKLVAEEEIKATIAAEEAAAKLAAAKEQAITALETTYGASYVTSAMEDVINAATDLDAVEIAKLAAEEEIKATLAAEEAEAKLAAAKAQAIATLETTYGASYVTDAMKNAINAGADLDAVALAKLGAEIAIEATIEQEIADAAAAALATAKTNAKNALKAYTDYYTDALGARIDAATSIEQVEAIRSALETDIKSTIQMVALETELNTLIADTNAKIAAMQNDVNANIADVKSTLNSKVAALQSAIDAVKAQISQSEATMTAALKAELESKVSALEGQLSDVEKTLTEEIHKKERPIEIKQWIAIVGSVAVIAAQAIIIIVILIKRRNMLAVEMARLEKEIERKKKEKKGVECNKCGVRLSVKPDGDNTYICPVCSNKFRVQKKKK